MEIQNETTFESNTAEARQEQSSKDKLGSTKTPE
jgi:hypothetical protein